MNFLLIWRLWHHFSNPPSDNQLYTWLYHMPESSRARSAVVALGCSLAMFILSGGIAILLLLLPLLSPIVGGVWTYGIAGVLRQRVTPFLTGIRVTPNGTIGSLINAALGVIHREGRFHGLVGAQIGIARTIAAAIIALLMLWWLVVVPLNTLSGLVFFPMYFLLIALIRWGYYLVHIYCRAVGILIGVLAATFRQPVIVVQIGGVLVYAGVMVLTTLIMAVLAVAIYNAALFVVTSWLTYVLVLGTVGVVISLAFILLAEGIVRVVWYVLVRRLQAPTDAHIMLGDI